MSVANLSVSMLICIFGLLWTACVCQDCESVVRGRTLTLVDWGAQGLAGGYIRGDNPVSLDLEIVVDESYDHPTMVVFIKSPTRELNDDITVELKSKSIVLYSQKKGIQNPSSSSNYNSPSLLGCLLPTMMTSSLVDISQPKYFMLSTFGCLVMNAHLVSSQNEEECEIKVSGSLKIKRALFYELVGQMDKGKFSISSFSTIIRNENPSPFPIRIGNGPNILIGPKCSGPHTFTNQDGICIPSLQCAAAGGFTATRLCNQFEINVLCCSGGNVTVEFPTLSGPACSDPHPNNANGDGACVSRSECTSAAGVAVEGLCNDQNLVCCSGNNILVKNTLQGPSCDEVNPIDAFGRGACVSVKTCALSRGNSISGLCRGLGTSTLCCSAPAITIDNT